MTNPVLDLDRVTFLKARDVIRKVLVPAWPRQKKELPLVEVDVRWVRFSTLNHRTRAEQMREESKSGDKNLFKSDPLGLAAQNAQYAILTDQEGFVELKADLRERGQQEPAIITAEGVLINGNRRTAALRNLLVVDKFLKAKYVQCLILPEDTNAEEVLDLEAELQVARDFKEEYSWINEALLIEELYDRENKDFERVGKRMHRSASDVRSLHEKLQQVHQLVSLSNGAKLHIDFKENESAFDELAKHIKNKPQAEADSVRSTYFLGTLAGVNYRKLRHLRRADASGLVLQEIRKDLSLKPLITAVEASNSTPNPSPLDDVLGVPPPSGLNEILSFLATKKPEDAIEFGNGQAATSKEILETLQGAINLAAKEAEDEAQDQTAVSAPIDRSVKAIAELERAIASLPKARTFSDWKEGDLAAKVKQLRELISKLETPV